MEYKEYYYKVGCKINAYLRILERDEKTGYHNIETLFYPLPAPYDTLRIQERKELGFSLHSTNTSLNNEDNKRTKAYTYLNARIPFPCGYDVTLTKHIPIGAGLGGGSADAAYFLRYAQQRFGIDTYTHDILQDVAKQIGADVPFFLQDEPKYGTGYGTELFDAPNIFAGMYCLVLCMPFSINTKSTYQQFSKTRKNTSNTLTNKRIFAKTFEEVGEIGNSFENLLFLEYPVMEDCKRCLLQSGALVVNVSGTGSSMFAVFDDVSCLFRAQKAVFHYTDSIYSYSL